jgi:GDP-L-fucose synthase
MERILVTGGTGQVGSELNSILPNAFFVSSKDYNLLNKDSVEKMIKTFRPDIVVHTAARVGGIIDNLNNQTSYYSENVSMDTNLIQTCLDQNVKKFIGILSTCAYPDVAPSYPMKESDLHYGAPTTSNFSYGIAKRGLATFIDSIRSEISKDYCYVIPCNLYGIHDKYNERSHFVASILMKILKAIKDGKKELVLFGTGQPLRQILYAQDLAQVIKLMIEQNVFENLNVASEDNLSIKAYTIKILEILGFGDWKIKFDASKPDGQYRKDVSIERMKEYFPNFQFTTFESGINEVFQSLSRNPEAINYV